ncbi:unnamed protein product [Mucor hiemalis]
MVIDPTQRPDVVVATKEGEYEDDEDVVVAEPAESSNDLTASEVRALFSVSTFLIQSSTVIGKVEAEQINAKLYLDRQESIPRSALSFCQKLVNLLRKLRCSSDKDHIAKFMRIRKPRNVIV